MARSDGREEPAVVRSLEDFELINTASQLRRAAEHAFAFYHGAFTMEECQQVVDESFRLLEQTARVKHHLVPLTERWSLDRLRRIGILDRRLVRTAAEVLFLDRYDTGAAPMAAALLDSHARGRVNIATAGEVPGDAVEPIVVKLLRELGIEVDEAFPKPMTDDALEAADLIILLGDTEAPSNLADRERRVRHWDIGELEGQSYETVRAARNELESQALRLLADLLTPAKRET